MFRKILIAGIVIAGIIYLEGDKLTHFKNETMASANQEAGFITSGRDTL